MAAKKILWIDDEIELLRSHIIFLSEKGFDVDTVTNGEDAISSVKDSAYDLIFLDEMMPGMGGLETLGQIKDINANIPVVMVTKNEEETLMDEAIGGKIADYLTKPVNPSQILLVCKKILEGKKISGQQVAKDYLQDFTQISQSLINNLDFEEWKDLYLKLVNWDLELDAHSEIGLRQTLNDQWKEANKEFSKFVEKNYKNWINNLDDTYTPPLSPLIVNKHVLPYLNNSQTAVFFFVIDCLRVDQWLVMEKHLHDYFKIDKDYYYAILPTATPYARNALFSGLFPSEIEKYYPDLWSSGNDDERSMNKYEKELLQLIIRS